MMPEPTALWPVKPSCPTCFASDSGPLRTFPASFELLPRNGKKKLLEALKPTGFSLSFFLSLCLSLALIGQRLFILNREGGRVGFGGGRHCRAAVTAAYFISRISGNISSWARSKENRPFPFFFPFFNRSSWMLVVLMSHPFFVALLPPPLLLLCIFWTGWESLGPDTEPHWWECLFGNGVS